MTHRGRERASEPDLGVLSAQLYLSLQELLWTSLAARGFADLRPRHGAVLAYLDNKGTRASELARRSGQHKQIIGTVVDELEALGYVQRRPDPLDRRAKLICPTARGLAEIRTAQQIIANIEHQAARAVGAGCYQQFKATLGELVERQRHATDSDAPDEHPATSSAARRW